MVVPAPDFDAKNDTLTEPVSLIKQEHLLHKRALLNSCLFFEIAHMQEKISGFS